MWGEAGFLSRVFAPFGELDVSVDLVATSQYAVSLTLDHIPGEASFLTIPTVGDKGRHRLLLKAG